MGDLPCACPASRLGPKPASRGSDKSHLSPGGLHPVIPSGNWTPFPDGRTGESSLWGDGTEGSAGLPPRRPVARTPAPCVRAPWRQRAAYRRMQVSCGGQGTTWALPRRENVPRPRESPRGKSPALAPVAPVVSPGSCLGAWSCSPGPRFFAGNAFCGHQGREAADAFMERGARALRDRGGSGHTLFLGGLAQSWRFEALGPSCPPRGRVGQFDPKQNS